MMRVLVMRPQAGAERTARQLALRGCEAIIGPVMRIEATQEPSPVGPFDALILTSANAVPALASLTLDARRLPVFAVGERTGSAVAEAGFRNIRIADGEAVSLAGFVAKTAPHGAKLLLIAGRDRKAEPKDALTRMGFDVALWTAYRAVALERFPQTVQHALMERRLDAALHYSGRSASLALDLAHEGGLSAEFRALLHVCLSADVAAPLQAAGAQLVSIAASPDENALLIALEETIGKSASAGSRATRSG